MTEPIPVSIGGRRVRRAIVVDMAEGDTLATVTAVGSTQTGELEADALEINDGADDDITIDDVQVEAGKAVIFDVVASASCRETPTSGKDFVYIDVETTNGEELSLEAEVSVKRRIRV